MPCDETARSTHECPFHGDAPAGVLPMVPTYRAAARKYSIDPAPPDLARAMKKLLDWLKGSSQADAVAEWERRVRAVSPPDVVEQRVLCTYDERYRLLIVADSGTSRGL